MKKLGIIAAKGDLTRKLIEYCQGRCPFFLVAIKGETDLELIKNTDHIEISIGEIGKAVEAMRANGVERIVFVGSLAKPDFLSLKVDMMGAKLLAQITKNKLFGDNNVLSTITKFLETHCFEVVGVNEILVDLVANSGIYTRLKPAEDEFNDIKIANNILDHLAEYDIGQGLVIENKVILAIEAIEGTDEMVKRCSSLKRVAEKAGILVKRAKLGQELRIDLPTIGLATIKQVFEAGLKGVAVQANKTIFLDREMVIEFADEHDLFIVVVE